MAGLHLFSQSGKIGESIKNQIEKELADDDQSRVAIV
jgi:hypothetical protein